jgi:hypothetical protein
MDQATCDHTVSLCGSLTLAVLHPVHQDGYQYRDQQNFSFRTAPLRLYGSNAMPSIFASVTNQIGHNTGMRQHKAHVHSTVCGGGVNYQVHIDESVACAT